MPRKQLLVVAFPGGEHAKYYKRYLGGDRDAILRVFAELSEKATSGGDMLLVLHDAHDRDVISRFGFPGNTKFLEVDRALDMWMRDFTCIGPELMIKTRYRPDYLKSRVAESTEREFMALLSQVGATLGVSTELVLDGGNVVENGEDKAIVTGRVMRDNKHRTEADIRSELESMLRRRVSVLTDPGDSTGHADGLVAFLDTRTLLLAHYGDARSYAANQKTLLDTFGDEIDIVKLPCFETKRGKSADIDNAIGCYVNALVTDNAVYVPAFGDAGDAVAMEIITSHTSKMVMSVNCAGVGDLGGNVRCITWQLYDDTNIAQALLKHAYTTPS